MRAKLYLTGVLALGAFILLSFKSWEVVLFPRPVNFPAPFYDFSNNELRREGIALGKELFYETALSVDNSISCGSCHIQSAAFTQHGHDVSHGVDDRLGNRNSPPIMNLAWSRSFFWDGGIFHLDLLPVSPITNPVEMDEQMPNVLRKLSSMEKYRKMFKAAYGSEDVNGERLAKALSQFMLMCISSESRYDSVMRKEVIFTAQERRGYLFFKKNCDACHSEPLFSSAGFRNNGLDHSFNTDSGRIGISLDVKDRYAFKVPSLRNLSFTAPYMHDGRFTSLQQVVDHYASGIQVQDYLDPFLLKDGRAGIPMSQADKADLVAFLRTLDDVKFITNKSLAEH